MVAIKLLSKEEEIQQAMERFAQQGNVEQVEPNLDELVCERLIELRYYVDHQLDKICGDKPRSPKKARRCLESLVAEQVAFEQAHFGFGPRCYLAFY